MKNTADKKRRVILILGGARSGKSHYAQQLASELGKDVLFVATGEALDAEMQKRIENHKKSRPASWETVEISNNIGQNLSRYKKHRVILIDCLTLLVANILGPCQHPELAEKEVTAEIEALGRIMETSHAHFIIVSNEVGLGIVPDNPLARIYRDLLGRTNQMIAQLCSEVYLMTAGIPLKIK